MNASSCPDPDLYARAAGLDCDPLDVLREALRAECTAAIERQPTRRWAHENALRGALRVLANVEGARTRLRSAGAPQGPRRGDGHGR